MAVPDWDPDQYAQFREYRARPFWDLVELVHRGGIDRAVDLGCGTGELTMSAADRLGVNRMTGIDSSQEMLDVAHRYGRVDVVFEYGDISRWTSDADHDLVLANAALQWVPDHVAVLERWISALAPAGQIAVQVPANDDHPSHLAAVHVATQEPFASAFGGEPPPDPVAANVLRPERYSQLLHDIGVVDQHVRLQVYPQVLDSSESVADWMMGSSLRRFFRKLPESMHLPFVDAYRDELISRVGSHAPYFYAFKRILMWGRVAG